MANGSTIFSGFHRWRLWLVVGTLVVGDLLITWFTYTATVQTVHEQVERRLEADLASTTRALAGWMQMKTLEAEVLAHRTDVRVSVLALVAGRQDAREDLRATLQEDVFGLGFDGFAVIDRSGRVVLGVDGTSDVGALAGEARDALTRALAAPSLLTPPLADPFGDGGPPRAMVLVPIDGRAGPAAALLLTMAPERQFAAIIDNGRDRRKGVAYAFDRRALILNDRDALIAGRGLETLLGHGGEPLPLVKAALAGVSGMDLVGAEDHLGIPRVAAARWYDDLGVGLYVGIDRAVALRPVQIGRYSVLAMSALLIVGTLLAVVYLFSNRALGRRLARAQATIAELGQYQLTRKLGEGGMGAVYLATHRLMRREVAVKLITGKADQEAIARFEREVQLCCTLTHPNTIQIYDYGRTDDGTFYYAMELLRGIDLEDAVALYGPLEPARVIYLLVQACGSLAEAHDRQLIHRDIKPANIFLCERGGEVDVVKVLDFGLVKSTEVQSARLSRDDVISGTPQYMAPEIAKQTSDVDGRSDQYSLACVGYFLLTGHCVFEHENVMRMVMDHMNTPAPRPSTRTKNVIPSDLEAVIMRCLEKDPAQRFPDARAFAAALSACYDADGWTMTAARAWWKERALPKPLAGASPTSKHLSPTLILGKRTLDP
jgi:eukaryotic-like serine/threonine-protein kinase